MRDAGGTGGGRTRETGGEAPAEGAERHGRLRPTTLGERAAVARSRTRRAAPSGAKRRQTAPRVGRAQLLQLRQRGQLRRDGLREGVGHRALRTRIREASYQDTIHTYDYPLFGLRHKPDARAKKVLRPSAPLGAKPGARRKPVYRITRMNEFVYRIYYRVYQNTSRAL